MSGADEGHGGPPPGRHHAQDESRPPVCGRQAQRCAQLISGVCRCQDRFLPGVLSTKFLSTKQSKTFQLDCGPPTWLLEEAVVGRMVTCCRFS